MEKTVINNSALKNVIRQMVSEGKTENDFLLHCAANYLDFEKGKKTVEEYWLGRYEKCIETERLNLRNAKKSGSELLLEACTIELDKVKLAKSGNGGQGRKKSAEKIRMEAEAAENLANTLKALKEKQRVELERKTRQAAAEMAPTTPRNEFDTFSNSEYIPEVTAAM